MEYITILRIEKNNILNHIQLTHFILKYIKEGV